jgi:hypothetical protein
LIIDTTTDVFEAGAANSSKIPRRPLAARVGYLAVAVLH